MCDVVGLEDEVDLDGNLDDAVGLGVTEGLDAVDLGEAAGLGEAAMEKGGLKPWEEPCDTIVLAKQLLEVEVLDVVRETRGWDT